MLLARFDDGAGTDNEGHRTMLELINQFDSWKYQGRNEF
jgi:ATP-dependent 26S proteasome regulatory subunit